MEFTNGSGVDQLGAPPPDSLAELFVLRLTLDLLANRFGFGLPFSEIGINVILVIQIVSDRAVDLPKRQRREAVLDLFGRGASLERCYQCIEGHARTDYSHGTGLILVQWYSLVEAQLFHAWHYII